MHAATRSLASVVRTSPIDPERDENLATAVLAEAMEANDALHAIATRLCGGEVAADLVQDVLTRLWQHPERFDPSRGPVRAYAITMIRGAAIDHLRSSAARRHREHAHEPGTGHASADAQALIGAETAAQVVRAMAVLSHVERSAIDAAFYDGLTYREVALRLGLAEGTVKSRIRTGLTKLRRELHDLQDDGVGTRPLVDAAR